MSLLAVWLGGLSPATAVVVPAIPALNCTYDSQRCDVSPHRESPVCGPPLTIASTSNRAVDRESLGALARPDATTTYAYDAHQVLAPIGSVTLTTSGDARAAGGEPSSLQVSQGAAR